MINPKLLELIELCVTISETTEHDVFFTYMPHVDLGFTVHYYVNGWESNNEGIYIDDISAGAEDIDIDNAISILKKALL